MSKKHGNPDYGSFNFVVQDISSAVNSSKLIYHELLALTLNDLKALSKAC